MKRIFYLILFISHLISAQEITLTLEESLELGLKNSKELIIANSRIKKAEAEIREVTSLMLPNLSLKGSYARLSEVPPFEVDLPTLPGSFLLQESFLNNYSVSATIEQPIFVGFRLSSLKSAANYNKSAHEIEYIANRIEKANRIEISFWRFYTSQQIVSLVNQNLTLLKSILSNTESMLDNGLATRNDLLKLKVEIGNMELRLVEAQNNVKLAQASFNKTIGLSFNAETNIVVDKINIEEDLYDLNEAITEAESNRQEIKSTKLRLNALDNMETAAKAEWFPNIYAFGNFYYSNPNQRFLPLEDQFNDSWDIGFAVKWEIWNWGGTLAKTEKVKQDIMITDNNLKLLIENIQLEVYNNFLDLQKAIKKIGLSELQIESAEENYRITEQKYYQQLATSTDLIDARTSLLDARISLLTSKAEYKIGLSTFNKSLGRNLEH